MMQKIQLWGNFLRIWNLAILALMLVLFYQYIIVPNHLNKLYTKLLPLTGFDFALFVLSVVLVAAAGNIINDYYDFDLDSEYKPHRALPQGLISFNSAFYLHAAFALTGIGIGFYLGYGYGVSQAGYVYILATILLYLYAAYLKKIAFVGNLIVALLTTMPLLLLFLFEVKFLGTVQFEFTPRVSGVLRNAVIFYAGFAFLTNLAREIVKDIEDKAGDEQHGVKTIAVLYGENMAKVFATMVLLIMVAALSYFMKGFWDMNAMKEFFYLLALIVMPTLIAIALLFMANTEKQLALVSGLIKAIMLFGILSMVAFYYFNLPAA